MKVYTDLVVFPKDTESSRKHKGECILTLKSSINILSQEGCIPDHQRKGSVF